MYCTSIPRQQRKHYQSEYKIGSSWLSCRHALLSKAHDSGLSGWKDLSEGCMRNQALRLTTWTQNAKRTLPLLVLLCVLWSSLWEIKVDLDLSICIFEFRRASQPILENLLTYTMELRKAKTDFLHNQSLTNTLNSSTALHPKTPHSWSVSHNSCRPCSSNWPQRPYTAHWHGVCRVLISSFLSWRRDHNSDNSAITIKFSGGLLSDTTTLLHTLHLCNLSFTKMSSCRLLGQPYQTLDPMRALWRSWTHRVERVMSARMRLAC